MSVLHVGAPMWAHRPWFGRILPRPGRPGEELASYATALNAVEGNTTFYAAPSPATVERWAVQVPEDFWFVLKAPREVTHERRLRDVGGPLRRFLDLVAPLGDRIGTVTLQLPASFAPADLEVLTAVARRLPSEVRWAVEVRHPGFFEGDGLEALDDVLGRDGIERVVFDTRVLFAQPPSSAAEREAWERKPRLPVLARALTDRPIVRFIGRDDDSATVDGWQDWVPVVAAWLAEGRRPTVFVHTPDNATAPALARAFHAEVGLVVPGLTPLPDPVTPSTGTAAADQPTLF